MQSKSKQEAREYLGMELGDYSMADRHRVSVSRAAMSGKEICAYVLTCPAYTSQDDIYTFEGLGGGVPMMARQHLSALEPLMDVLLRNGARFSIRVLIADVEALNVPLVERYTNGVKEAYLDRCYSSVQALQDAYEMTYAKRGVVFSATSFMKAFEDSSSGSQEPNNFLHMRSAYKEILEARFAFDRSFAIKVTNTVRSKVSDRYYQREYGEIALPPMDQLTDRELTTMSEYLALGNLIGSTACQPIVVIHGSGNAHLINAGNTFTAEGNQANRQSIPLVIREKRVY